MQMRTNMAAKKLDTLNTQKRRNIFLMILKEKENQN